MLSPLLFLPFFGLLSYSFSSSLPSVSPLKIFYSPVSKHGLPNHSPCCCSRHQALSFMAARPIWPGFMVREGGSPSHFKRILKLHSNVPKALLNILPQVSPPHCISNPLPDSLTTQPGSSIWLFKSPPLGKKCDLQQMKKTSPKWGSTNMPLFGRAHECKEYEHWNEKKV